MINQTCPDCDKGLLREQHGTYMTRYADSHGDTRALEVKDVSWAKCDVCGEEFLDDVAMHAVEEARKRASKMLTSHQLSALRRRHNKTQKAMSELLGSGEKTWGRWESGALQSEAFDRFVRLLIEEPRNLRLLEKIAAWKQTPAALDIADLENRDDEQVFRYVSNISVARENGAAFTVLMSTGDLLGTTT